MKCTPKQKKRKTEMKFAVGTIVKFNCAMYFKLHNTPLVIIGWTECDDLKLRAKNQSVWYLAFSAERDALCIREDNLEKLNTPTLINSCLLGEYFSEFKGTYYMPNKMLATEYPDDVLYLVNEL
ncbi:F-box only protein 21 [Ooceraea biroi]|uniref:F-box only protein 21 n=1 Tax=Ooceraea biroi TaxID=2015173 RepID=UPI0009716272|nr:F-box only protein 21 [Ooceraea biroi]